MDEVATFDFELAYSAWIAQVLPSRDLSYSVGTPATLAPSSSLASYLGSKYLISQFMSISCYCSEHLAQPGPIERMKRAYFFWAQHLVHWRILNRCSLLHSKSCNREVMPTAYPARFTDLLMRDSCHGAKRNRSFTIYECRAVSVRTCRLKKWHFAITCWKVKK